MFPWRCPKPASVPNASLLIELATLIARAAIDGGQFVEFDLNEPARAAKAAIRSRVVTGRMPQAGRRTVPGFESHSLRHRALIALCNFRLSGAYPR